MIKRLTTLLLGFLLLVSSAIKADEGMWLLPLLQKYNIQAMQQKGFKLTADDIYNLNQASIKDAVIIFGRGCTGEVVSDQGLVLTNHHCGYGAIQQHSTPEHDYLEDGFWAKSFEEEIPTPGLTATFLIRIEDVTDQVNAAFKPEMSEADRDKAAMEIGRKIAKQATDGTHYTASVRSFFGGNQYFLLVYEVFNDVRLVGAPPSSIGKFGHDTDNWMWPRHTGDFSVFRIYASKDNKPADYSRENVPYKPKHFLPISLKGVNNGDFTMIMGYPGSTQRYMTSVEVQERINILNANRIYVRGIKQEIWLKDMQADKAVNIKYASKYAGSSNYWKNSIGMNKALKRLKVYDFKKQQEEEFTKWVLASPERQQKYGEALSLINEGVTGRKEYLHASQYISEALFSGTEIIGMAAMTRSLVDALKGNKTEEVTKISKSLKARSENFYKNYNTPTDQKTAKAMFRIFMENVPLTYQPDIFNTIRTKYKGDVDKFVDQMFAKTMFTDPAKFNAFLDKPSLKVLEKDPVYVAAASISNKYEEISKVMAPFNEKLQRGQRLYIAGVLEMNEGKAMYPDANFTMRLTYGEIKDYYPMDAVHYDYLTTLDGVMEKEDPDNWEFVVPAKLKELYNSKDYGRYGKDGKMPVAFISTNDITGGNSGSPVMNGNGELIGIAFDGNWEAMSGDIVFENKLQRTISVDIRYVLFVIDKYAGATRLIDEMKIIE
ncbi:MAG: S46 family peptidase [Tenuifilum sp.]|uniref:S46 family peptidase n=1 Tax=Tenuifilum sp. TaxID=2760880 RepID=UPI002CBD7678|nr:S46 family peptidase [Tenuifilum sp.]HOK86122.1 S46 family peptidase [Tenuifilum sp.]HON70030.1 S46 family peptidase [Tenuifilum sp.]HOU73994.1 S46 family peptidase [Tenuifilum sp.]HPP90525.1 S46 family peptidase [Tenuifilum sp.]